MSNQPETSPPIPQAGRFDSSLALLLEGYAFAGNRHQQLGSDIFRTRLMGRRAVCITGAEAAAFFYDNYRFTRQGSMPPTTLRLLQDIGSVQSLDGSEHRHRKHMFMDLMGPESRQRFEQAFADAWHEQAAIWSSADQVVLTQASREVLTAAACAWAGVPLSAGERAQRSQEFGAMIDGAGSIGPRLVMGLVLRSRNERWARGLIDQTRKGHLDVPADSPLARLADHRQPDGTFLPTDIAAVELINLLRPTVAIGNYLTFAALALHTEHDARDWVMADLDGRVEPFVLELRRYYPFFPFIGGRARADETWRGYDIPAGTWVLLDLYGTNHDARLWPEPDRFNPSRFVDWQGDPYTLVPQGAGDFHTGHRCPGEWLTIDTITRTVRLLAAMTYDVPSQDLKVRLNEFPAQPRSRFVLERVRP